MADVAFLLLLFFLVAATINVESGLRMTLPPLGGHPPLIQERNLLNVFVRPDGAVLVDGRFVTRKTVSTEVVQHLTNEGQSPLYADSPQHAIVSFKTARGVPYGIYIATLDALLLGYRQVHDRFARDTFGSADYAAYRAALALGQRDAVVGTYPVKLSLAEPDPR